MEATSPIATSGRGADAPLLGNAPPSAPHDAAGSVSNRPTDRRLQSADRPIYSVAAAAATMTTLPPPSASASNKPKIGQMTFVRSYMTSGLAEAVGSFFVTFFTRAALMLLFFLQQNRECCNAGRVELALATGLAYFVNALAFRRLHAGHANPVFTLAWIGTRVRVLQAIIYWIAQLAGALMAGVVLNYLFSAYEPTLGTPVPVAGFNAGRTFFLESLGTFFVLLFTTLASHHCKVKAVAYGAAVAVFTFVASYFTGASFNPFAHLAVAIWSGVWTQFVVYFFAPFVGAIVMMLLWWVLFLGAYQDMDDAAAAQKANRA